MAVACFRRSRDFCCWYITGLSIKVTFVNTAFITLGSKCYYRKDLYYAWFKNLITDGTFITLAWVKMLLQKRPLLRLGPVITLVPSTPVRLARWKWKCRNDGALFLCARWYCQCCLKKACGLWFHLSSEHFDLISVVCKSVYHENVFLFFKHFVKERLLHSLNLREKGRVIYVFVQQLSTPQK